jgi:site-specific DNA recombinase
VVFNGVEYAGADEPLVSQELFDRAQEVFSLHDRDKVRERKRPLFLRGIVACGSCGSALSSMVAKGRSSYYPYFYCLGRFTGRTDCKEPYIAQEDLEAIVECVYRGLEPAKDEEDCLRAALEQEMADEVSFSDESLALAKKRHAKTEAELDRAVSAYLAGAMDMKLYKREQERLQTEIRTAETEIRRAEAVDSPYQQLLETALNCIRDANRRYVGADPYVKRLLNALVLKRIEIKGGKLVSVQLKPPFRGLFLLAGSNKGSLVGGPGFEPGASRSRSER